MILERNAPAKINLGLQVLHKRPDGFHEIQSILTRIGWSDRLVISYSDTFRFTCTDPRLPTDGSNLCVKATALLLKWFKRKPRIRMHLDKRLPFGAGLGGGSSDAATTLLLVNEFMNINADPITLYELATRLGSDVPFFLESGALLASGRGEMLSPFLNEKDERYELPFDVGVVVPPIHVSTAGAYQNITPRGYGRVDLCELVRTNDLERWRAELVNDFEPTVFRKYPVIGEIKRHLLRLGAGYASMSGSGSAVYGLFEDREERKEALEFFKSKNMQVWPR